MVNVKRKGINIRIPRATYKVGEVIMLMNKRTGATVKGLIFKVEHDPVSVLYNGKTDGWGNDTEADDEFKYSIVIQLGSHYGDDESSPWEIAETPIIEGVPECNIYKRSIMHQPIIKYPTYISILNKDKTYSRVYDTKEIKLYFDKMYWDGITF